jgi:hypothetical protein
MVTISGLVLLLTGCLHWVKWEGPQRATPVCDAEVVLARLDTAPQPDLSWLDRHVAFLSTPFKRRGLNGWQETYCLAEASGVLERPARYSNDGFWTLDLRLRSFRVGALTSSAAPRFLRVEIEPHTAAHDVADRTSLGAGTLVTVHGVLVIDTDRNFLEIHPDTGFAARPPES